MMSKRIVRIVAILLSLMLALTVGAFAAKKVKSKSVSLNITKVTLNEGAVVSLNATMKPKNTTDSISWSTSNKKIATVNSKGVVRGVTEGKAVITATTTSKKKATCTVTVKKYITKAELLDSIQKNTLSKESVESIINEKLIDSYYTKEETDGLIQDTIEGKKYITEENASELIEDVLTAKDYLTKGDAAAYATKEQLGSYVTEEEAQQLIAQNTYSEDDIKALVEKFAPSHGNDDWEGTVELELVEDQELPYSAPLSYDLENEFTINSISLTKEKYNDVDETGRYYLYKYTLNASGSISAFLDEQRYYRIYVKLLDANKSLQELEFTGVFGALCSFDDDTSFTATQSLLSNVDASYYLIFEGAAEYE